jgi:nuclear pore complex protein Nup54
VLAIGFPDLKTRLASQEGEANRQSSHLKTINERISALEQKHSLSDSVRTSAAMKRQTALHHRIVSIARKSHVLIPSLRGTSVTKEEEALRSKLEACEAELESAGGSEGGGLGGSGGVGGAGATNGRLRARVNELWSMLGAVKTRREMLEQEGRKPSVEWAVVDERGVEEVANVSKIRTGRGRRSYRPVQSDVHHTALCIPPLQILAQQQQGLNHLIATLEEDSRALDTVLQGLKGVQLIGTVKSGAGFRGATMA